VSAPPTFEIVPGQSVGPVRLGMNAAEVAALGAQGIKEIEAVFDEAGACRLIRAKVPEHPLERPRFSLAGRLLNGLPATEVDALLASLAADVRHEHALTHALSIGLFAIVWNRLQHYKWLVVVRPGDAQSVARRGMDSEPGVLDIVPGRSIGPVVLGMSRDEYAAVESRAPSVEPWFRRGGKCDRIVAWVPLAYGQPPFFRLAGHILNGLWANEVDGVFQCDVPAVGLSACKWEYIDEYYTSVSVFAAKPLSASPAR
jgi:hypothetical protein